MAKTQAHTWHIIRQHPVQIGTLARQNKIAQTAKNNYLKVMFMNFDHFWRFLASQEIHRMPVMATAIVELKSQGIGLRTWVN